MALTREAILGAEDRTTVEVSVPEWGGTVLVRALTGTERDAYEESIVRISAKGMKEVNLKNLRGRLVALSCVTEDGGRMFTNEDAVELGGKNAAALERIFDVARKLSGLTEGDVEELAEGFGDAPSEPDTSD